MLKYKLDTITRQEKEFIVYVHVMDGEKIIKSVSLCYKNKEDFKKVLITKTVNIKAEYDEMEIKKIEIEKILGEM